MKAGNTFRVTILLLSTIKRLSSIHEYVNNNIQYIV